LTPKETARTGILRRIRSISCSAGSAARALPKPCFFPGQGGLPDLQLVNPFSSYRSSIPTGRRRQPDAVPSVGRTPVRQRVAQRAILLDDFQIDNKGPPTRSPRIGEGFRNVLVKFPSCKQLHTLSLEYRYLSRWLYNVSAADASLGQRYMYLGRSLGYPRMTETVLTFLFLLPELILDRDLRRPVHAQGENSLWTPWKNMSADSLVAPGALGYRTEKSFPSARSKHVRSVC